MPRLSVAVRVVVVVLMAFGVANAATYTDPAGDTSIQPGGAQAGDIIGADVSIANNALAVQVRFAPGTLPGDDALFFAIIFDTNGNPNDGDTFVGVGAEYGYFVSRFEGEGAAFVGPFNEDTQEYEFEILPLPSISGDTIDLAIPLAGIGGATQFNFRMVSAGAQNEVDDPTLADFLPDIDEAAAVFGGTPQPIPPSVLAFTASPLTIAAGQSSTLAWRTSQSDNVTITSLGNVAASGSAVVSPTQTTTYTLNVSSTGGIASAQVTVTVVTTPVLVISRPPQGITQLANTGGGTDSIVITNVGGGTANVVIPPLSNLFTVSPSSFSLPAGQSREITITANAQPAGAFEGSITIGNISIRIPVLSSTPSNGAAPASTVARIDVTGNSGTVRFVNNGSQALQAIAVADVPWVRPETGLINIAANGGTRDVSFEIVPALRSNPFGSETAEISLVYISNIGPGLFKGSGTTNKQSLSVTLVQTTPIATPGGTIPPLGTGEVAFFVPGLTRTASLVSDVIASNRPRSSTAANLTLYYLGVGTGASTARVASFNSVSAGASVTLADAVRSAFNTGAETGTLQVRSTDAPGLGVAASLFNKVRREGLVGTSLRSLRADRGFSSPNNSYIPGIRTDSSTTTTLYLQEMGGADAIVQTNFVNTSGVPVTSRTDNVPAFSVVELKNVVPSGAVAAVLTSLGGGRIAGRALVTETGSGDVSDVIDWGQRNGIGAVQPQSIPFARIDGTSRTEVVITNRGTEALTGTLSFVGGGSRRRVVGRRANIGGSLRKIVRQLPPVSDAAVSISLAPNQSRVINAADLSASGTGMILYQPLTGFAAVSARTITTSAFGAISTSLPVVGAASGLRLGDSKEFASVESASAAAVTAGRPGSFQSALGLVETGGRDAKVRATLRYTQAAPGSLVQLRGVASRDYSLRAREFVRVSDLARDIIGAQRDTYDDLRGMTLEITVVEGEGSVVPMIGATENGTGDLFVRMD
jgi:hypothetical protein